MDPLTKEECLEKVSGYLQEDSGLHTIFAVNPEKNFSVPQDPVLQGGVRSADLLIPDGIGVVLAARILHSAKLSRIPGVEFMEAICALAAKKGHKVFVYGAREEVNKKAVDILLKRHPGLDVAG